MRFFVLQLGIFLFCTGTAEGALPAWLKAPPKEDSLYRYYVGRSNPAPSQAEAFKQAYQDAIESAIKENFGYSLEINKSSYQSAEKANLSEKVREQFRQVEVHGFELQDQYFAEGRDATMEAFTLFRYSKLEIRRERNRLDALKEGEPVRSFSELKGRSQGIGATLTVVTKPSNASIYIDGEAYGKSDAKIRNLSAGLHKLKLDHDNYEPVEEEVNLTPGAELRVEEHLQLSKGQVKITSSLPSALITLNGKIVGTTPTEFLSVNAGEEFVIRAEHPEAELMLQKIEVSRNEKREVSLQLQPKPSFVALLSKPPKSKVIVDGKELGTTDAFGRGKFPVAAGSQDLLIRKEGYEDRQIAIELRGGETKQLGEVRLTSLAELKAQNDLEERLALERAENRKREQVEEERLRKEAAASAAASKPWRILIGLGGSGSPVTGLTKATSYTCCALLDLGLERHLGSFFAFRATYTYRGGSAGNQNDTVAKGAPNSTREALTSSNGNEIALGTYVKPISNLLLGPEIGSASTKLSFQTTRFDINGAATVRSKREDQLTQRFLGINLGYESTPGEKVGGYLDLGVRKYDDSGIYKGGSVFQIKGGLMVGF